MTIKDKRSSGVVTNEDSEVLAWWEKTISTNLSSSHSLKILLADDFPGTVLNSVFWDENKTQYTYVHDGHLWFDIPTNNRDNWYADILEPRLRHHDYFIRIEFIVRLESLPGKEIGYLGIQTDCDRGWMLVYVGESIPGLIVEYSREAETDLDYCGPSTQKVASISFNHDYKIELVWQDRQVIVLLDGNECAKVPSVPSRYFNLNAGVRPGLAVRGTIKALRVWC